MQAFKINCLEHLLFAAYLLLFAWLVIKTKFFTHAGLTESQLIIIFLLKVLAGIFYGWVGVYYGNLAQMVDTWGYYYNSLHEFNLLKSDPKEFFTSLFHNPYEGGYSKFFSSNDSWWNDLHLNLFIKILALFNLLSFGHYYINVIFYSFISLFGAVAIYRVMRDVFPAKKIEVLLATFLLPSFIYWTSGIHKDGVVFLAIALIVHTIYFGLKRGRFTLKHYLLLFLCFLIILGLRNYLLVILIPALVAWILSSRMSAKPLIVFPCLYLVFISLFFTVRHIHPKLDFPKAVVNKQKAFLELRGGSAVAVTELQPSFTSFIFNSPEAIALSAIRPYPSDVQHLLALAAAVEINVLIFLFVVFLFWRSNGIRFTPFILFCLFFSLSALITIGYTVSFLGAIVRYRSIILPFLVIPLVAKINWQRIESVVLKSNSNKI